MLLYLCDSKKNVDVVSGSLCTLSSCIMFLQNILKNVNECLLRYDICSNINEITQTWQGILFLWWARLCNCHCIWYHNNYTLRTERKIQWNIISHVMSVSWRDVGFVNMTYVLVFTKMTKVNLSAFVYRLFHEDISVIIGTHFKSKLCSDDWREIFMTQSVNKYR